MNPCANLNDIDASNRRPVCGWRSGALRGFEQLRDRYSETAPFDRQTRSKKRGKPAVSASSQRVGSNPAPKLEMHACA